MDMTDIRRAHALWLREARAAIGRVRDERTSDGGNHPSEASEAKRK